MRKAGRMPARERRREVGEEEREGMGKGGEVVLGVGVWLRREEETRG